MTAKTKRKPSGDLYIAAIGASAGGLEALQKLLLHIPDSTTNLALIVVQHLSPNYKSMLVQSLRNQTGFEVIEARNGIQVKRKSVYVTPPDRDIIIEKGKLYLSKPAAKHGPRPSINNLFSSLAADRKARAIGIILSGTGTDGATGMAKIAEKGGITIVQEVATAKFKSMPQAAIEATSIDWVLAPSKIGAKLVSMVSGKEIHKLAKTATAREQAFDNIIELLARRKGTDFANYKKETLYRRIEKRLSELKIKSPEQYFKYLEKNSDEAEVLFDRVLIGVTGFFRDAPVFKALQKNIEATIDSKIGSEPLRVWTPGCATGEEAYSIAIIVDMALKKKNRAIPVQIFATDINETSLTVARRAAYKQKDLVHMPSVAMGYFVKRAGDLYEISKNIRSMILFSRHDLTHNPPFLKLDLIVCRNLLIYFNKRLQEYVFPVFYSALNPNGYLVLGRSESIGKFSDLFATVKRDAKIYQRKTGRPLRTIRYTPLKIEQQDKETGNDLTIPEMVKETLYKVYEHPYVVVNDAIDIQEISGDVSMYIGLKQGQMNANLIRMAHRDLKIELRSLALKCIRENKETQSRVQKLNINGKDHYVKITIRPLLYAVKPDEFYMVAFEEVKVADTSQKIITPLEKKKKAGSGNYGRNSIQPEPTFRELNRNSNYYPLITNMGTRCRCPSCPAIIRVKTIRRFSARKKIAP